MSLLDDWAYLIARQLKSEAEAVAVQAKSELYEDVARETFIRLVLEPFLPASYAIGSGRVIDASGNISSAQDIVIYRNDYPQFNMPGSQHVFIYESVLATIQVSSKLVRKSFFNALDQCASMGELDPFIEPETIRGLAAKMNMKLDDNKQYVHPEPLNTDHFNLIGRPQCFIYAFTGYQTSEKQLAENLKKWINHYQQDHDALHMKSVPSVIATQGCFAWRNSAPFTIKLPALMGVGKDKAPLRLIILQLMQALNRRLKNTSDGYGIRSNIAPYMTQFERPVISEVMGKVLNPGQQKPMSVRKPEVRPAAANQQRPVSASAKPVQPPSAVARHTPRKPVPKSAPIHPEPTSASSPNNLNRRVEQPVQLTNKPVSAAHRKNETPAPVIEDRSKQPRPANSDTALREQTKVGAHTSKPLSLFDEEEIGEIDEYEFQPIEPPRHQSSEDNGNETREPVKNDFESTQKIDMSSINKKKSEGQGKEVDQDFLDTLVEEPEVLAKNDSKPAAHKPGYVKEMLI